MHMITQLRLFLSTDSVHRLLAGAFVFASAIMSSGAMADEPTETVSAGPLPLHEFIDAKIRQNWTDNEIEPSAIADDEEWIRRVYLDMVGRIPSLKETEAFLADKNPRKRSIIIDELLGHDDFVRNLTTIWTNNCIGRGEPRRVSRRGMEKFFREAFAKNRPWNEVVVDIITASGHFEENGAVNYILAQMQMNDEAVQLTAMTTRLFLGLQVQCTQCHNHPFNKWQQSQFWEFNSFFRQVGKIDHRRLDPNTGRQVDDYSEVVWQEFTGPVYYEKRSGLMQVAFPIFQGQEVDPGVGVDRRAELAKLICNSEEGQPPQVALSMVNRMWAHFFGYGFTRPVDDMGPHNPASHPEVLNRLAQEFADNDYNVRDLVRWIVSTEAYQLGSKYNNSNEVDNPAAGEIPLFSHMYVKAMQAEQLYDSLITASNAHQSGNADWSSQEAQRRRWMQQFIVAFDNDENDESTTFNGTIPQALMMMNSELIDKACSTERGSFLAEELASPGKETDKISRLYLAALGREPNRTELGRTQKFINAYGPEKLKGFQDLFWALLNSNEFILNH